MSEQPEAPKKIWLEYTPDEQHLYLTDDLVWTGYLTEYVRADNHDRLVEALRFCVLQIENEHPDFDCLDNLAADKARALLTELENQQ